MSRRCQSACTRRRGPRSSGEMSPGGLGEYGGTSKRRRKTRLSTHLARLVGNTLVVNVLPHGAGITALAGHTSVAVDQHLQHEEEGSG